ncbi:hypothetical protein D3C76_1500710 [compost metagenome]
MDQRSVSRYINLEAFGMSSIQQLADLRMQQRLSLNMKIDMIAVRLDLIQNFVKGVQLHEVFRPLRRRAKAAGQVADACNLDVYLFKCLQVLLPISISL